MFCNVNPRGTAKTHKSMVRNLHRNISAITGLDGNPTTCTCPFQPNFWQFVALPQCTSDCTRSAQFQRLATSCQDYRTIKTTKQKRKRPRTRKQNTSTQQSADTKRMGKTVGGIVVRTEQNWSPSRRGFGYQRVTMNFEDRRSLLKGDRGGLCICHATRQNKPKIKHARRITTKQNHQRKTI